jgi:putative tricarboxylic transport membrane protein
MQISDRVTGLFLVALGGLAAYGGSRLPPVPGQQMGPEIFPMVVGGGLILCGGLIAAGVGRRYEDEAEADLARISAETEADGMPAAAHHSRWWELRVLIPPALLLFYYFVVDRLGFLPTAAVVVFTASLALGAKPRLAVPLAIVAPLFVNLIFLKLLRVPLPSGMLPLPWIGLP